MSRDKDALRRERPDVVGRDVAVAETDDESAGVPVPARQRLAQQARQRLNGGAEARALAAQQGGYI